MFSLNLKSNGDNNKMTKDCWSRLETVRKNLGFASKDKKWVGLVKYYKSGPDLKNKILRVRKKVLLLFQFREYWHHKVEGQEE